MNRNKPNSTASEPTSQQVPTLSFKSSTSRVVKSTSNSSISSNNNKQTTPATISTISEPTAINNTTTPVKNHKAEQWSYAQEGKLDQVINNTLVNYSMSVGEDLLSTNSYACQEDNESIYSHNFYIQTEGENMESSDYVRGGRLKFGTYKQEEIAITSEIDASSALKRKKDDIKLPVGWNQNSKGSISSTQNKKKKPKHK